MITDNTGIASIQIFNLLKLNLTDKELRKEIRSIIVKRLQQYDNNKLDYIKKLEKEVENYRTIKKLLK